MKIKGGRRNYEFKGTRKKGIKSTSGAVKVDTSDLRTFIAFNCPSYSKTGGL
jgi:hypothetical protein